MAATPAYWFCMYAASALGTNLGDFWVDGLGLGREWSFVSLAVISALAIWADRRFAAWTELGYWIAIVALRAAATTVADAMTHDLRWSYAISALMLAIATLVAGRFTNSSSPAGGRGFSASPTVNGRYWIAMLIAGVFGTVAGDLASHTIGLFPAAGILAALLVALLVWRSFTAPASITLYWCVILAERCAGTPAGDALASHRGAGLGLPTAIACTGGALVLGLLVRERTTPRTAYDHEVKL